MTTWSRCSRVLRRCPGEQRLAAYADRQLVGDERQVVEKHIASCDDCLQQVGFLVRSTDTEGLQPCAELLQRARRLTPAAETHRFTGWRWVAVATALPLALTGAILLHVSRRHELSARSAPVAVAAPQPVAPPTTIASLPPSGSPHRDVSPIVRGTAPGRAAPRFISPAEGTVIDRKSARFTWSPVANASYYVLKVVSPQGELVWEGQSKETKIRVPSESLKRGEYFAWVSSYREDGRVAKSQAIRFLVGTDRSNFR